MKFGALSYGLSRNVGDEVQTLAALQYLPQVDHWLDRDLLERYRELGKVFLICNGWFKFRPREGWPPPENLKPLLISFYAYQSGHLIREDLVEFYQSVRPIGCRSMDTLREFERAGVSAYFSGCLTLTLKNRFSERSDDVYIVDVDENMLSRLVPSSVRHKAIYVTHQLERPYQGLIGFRVARMLFRLMKEVEGKDPKRRVLSKLREHYFEAWHKAKLQRARDLLALYSRAKLVVTGKLHCAMPCLALGTPVVLLKEGVDSDRRFDGLYQLVRHCSDTNGRALINWERPEPNSDLYLPLAESLRRSCAEAVLKARVENEVRTDLEVSTHS